jgi:succinyl-CoA synthetase beta subunit
VESEGIECMLEEIPGLGKLLAGYRGAPAYDKKSLVSLIEKLSDFVLANEGNLELVEINPVRVMQEGGGAQILDCVIKFI